MSGTRLQLTGQVLDSACRPIGQARLDFWQADAGGVYDNTGYRLRGHESSDANGRFSLQTIVPGLYPGRTRHIHVKVQPPGGSTLTTQLYFPGEARNAQDSIFDAALLLQVSDSSSGKLATFTFVTGSA
jgi:protocatechuate 3,4-dioxygenase beta subunit